MWHAFIEVISELWSFALHGWQDGPSQAVKTTHREPVVPTLSNSQKPKLLHTEVSGQKAFVVKRTDCFLQSDISLDTKVGSFSYGETVTVLAARDEMLHVAAAHVSGWVRKEGISFDKASVTPTFISGEVYEADNIETMKLRALIEDDCSGGLLIEPLQGLEFVIYMLWIQKKNGVLAGERPRLPGMWQTRFKGRPQVKIGIEPKTGAIMEYFTDHNSGVLSYVVAVHPDQSIVIQNVGAQRPGEYQEVALNQAAWREYRPVFISFL